MRNGIILAFIVVLFLLGCAGHVDINISNNSVNNVTANGVTISQIKSDPSKFVGRRVVIHGIYMGWKGDGPPPVTRSDWVIDDGTGRIYVTGIFPNLNPIKDIGKNITVVGYVKVINEKPYIEATYINY